MSTELDSSDKAEARLLIIEDNEEISDILAEVGAEAGFVVDEARTVEAAKASYRTLDPRLIILDLGLSPEGAEFTADSGEEGLQMLEFLAEAECQAKILIISGMSRRKRELMQVRGQGMKLRVIGHIPKPFDVDVVQKLLDDIYKRES